ncbi:hypothetical protein YC2023_093995 [Brassica napus]
MATSVVSPYTAKFNHEAVYSEFVLSKSMFILDPSFLPRRRLFVLFIELEDYIKWARGSGREIDDIVIFLRHQ